MIPAAFAYDRPSSIDEALGLLAGDADAKVLAGGQSLLPLLKLRLAGAARLIDIGRIRELRGIRSTSDGGVSIGALTTYRELLASPLATGYRCLAEALPEIGDIQVRNRGTVGGSVAHADPASDMPAVLLALDATLVARSKDGERRIKASEFFHGAFHTALGAGELLTEIVIPASGGTGAPAAGGTGAPAAGGTGSAYRKLAQPASGYSIVGVAAVVGRAGPTIASARIGITGVGDVAYRATGVESALVGSDGSAAAIAAAAAHAADGVNVASDIHADRTYRAQMATVYVRRAIEGALAGLG